MDKKIITLITRSFDTLLEVANSKQELLEEFCSNKEGVSYKFEYFFGRDNYVLDIYLVYETSNS
jgi:hypothetical protein